MGVRRTAAQIVSCFQLVRAQVHWHICTHLHCYSLFQYRDQKGFHSHTHFAGLASRLFELFTSVCSFTFGIEEDACSFFSQFDFDLGCIDIGLLLPPLLPLLLFDGAGIYPHREGNGFPMHA